MASGGQTILGLSLTGELRGGRVEEGRPRSDGDGKWPDRFILSIATDQDTFRVEYRSEDDARAAVPAEAAQGDIVSVPVSVRAARGFVFYMGRGAGMPDSGDLSW